MIFNPPAAMNGTQLCVRLAISGIAITGASAAPVVRATPVIPAAAVRSDGASRVISERLASLPEPVAPDGGPRRAAGTLPMES